MYLQKLQYIIGKGVRNFRQKKTYPNCEPKTSQAVDRKGCHELWSKVHPVIRNENFVRIIFPGLVVAINAHCPTDIERLKNWNRSTNWIGTLNADEMLIVIPSK